MLGLERFFGRSEQNQLVGNLPSAEIVKSEGYSPEFVEAKSREVHHVLVAIQESARLICESCPSAPTELSPVVDSLSSGVRSVLRQLKDQPDNIGHSLFLFKSLDAGRDLFEIFAKKATQPLSREGKNQLVSDLIAGIHPLVEGFADLSDHGREVVDHMRLEALLNSVKELAAYR